MRSPRMSTPSSVFFQLTFPLLPPADQREARLSSPGLLPLPAASAGDRTRGRQPSCGGSRRHEPRQRFWLARGVLRRGGHPPAPAFPQRGKRERGVHFLAAAGLLPLALCRYPEELPAWHAPRFSPEPPIHHASIRTFVRAHAALCAVWCPKSLTGAAISMSNSACLRKSRSAPRTQSPEPGDLVSQLIPLPTLLSPRCCTAVRISLPSLCRFLRLAVAQRFVFFSAYPQPVQQHRQLPRHRHHRPPLGILIVLSGQLHAPAP
jgi:hypothetical protein